MSYKKIGEISCSLNLGLIYDLEYSFDPKGSTITIHFVNTTGKYIHPQTNRVTDRLSQREIPRLWYRCGQIS